MIEAPIKKILKILKAIPSLSPRTLYHLVLKSSVKEIPQIQVIETKNGTFSGLSNDYLFKMAISQGTNEKHFVKLVGYLLGSSSVALDLGGNIGTHSITMSKLVKEGEVITFEPQSLTFSILQNNLLLNKCKNVTSYRFACSDENYKTISMQPFNFVTEPGDDYINNGALRVDLNSFVGDLALTRTIDSFNFEKLDFEIISNVTALPENDPKKIKMLLVEQIYTKVSWRESIINMSNNGINEFIEIGPGKVLSGLVKRINKDVKVFNINSIDDITNYINK